MSQDEKPFPSKVAVLLTAIGLILVFTFIQRSEPAPVFEMSATRRPETNWPAKATIIFRDGNLTVYELTYKGASWISTSVGEIVPIPGSPIQIQYPRR